MKVLNCTGIKELNKIEFNDFEILGNVARKEKILEEVSLINPDIVLISYNIEGKGNLLDIINELQEQGIRVIYLNGNIKNITDIQLIFLDALINLGVYDIITTDEITKELLEETFKTKGSLEKVFWIKKKAEKILNKSLEGNIKFKINIEENKEEEEKNYYDNLFAVSSIKPGTGKSFLSTNLATAIAKYSNKKPKPKVAIIEADFQNISVGTLLDIKESKQNLKYVLGKIRELFDEHDILTDDIVKIETVDRIILSTFKPYKKVNNLYCLVGDYFTDTELALIRPIHYAYLINVVVKNYDYVIIDTNSSFTHFTTEPVLKLANKIFYIVNLDYNNIKNNLKYKDFVENRFKIKNKIHYILNEDISKEYGELVKYTGLDLEQLEFTANHIEGSFFDLVGKIPIIPKVIFLNNLYNATPICLSSDKRLTRVKYELLKIAKMIDNDIDLTELEEELKNKETKKKRWFFRR